MSRIYMLRTVPAWNTWVTPISFFISAILFGMLILSIAVSLLVQTHSSSGNLILVAADLVRMMGWGSAILLSAQLLISFVKDRILLWRGGTSEESIRLMKQRHPALGLLRAIFGFLGIGLCILFALQPFSNTDFVLDIAILLAFLLTLTSEILGRFLFYASFKRSGI
jgi:anaerobic dimethyl sulfoxide reductase subunit C (anchor subunit)